MTNNDFNNIISKMFRAGILIVSILLIIGWISSIQFSQNVFDDYRTYKTESLLSVLTQAWQQQQWGLLVSYLGLAILISLPLLRVLISTVLFAKTKEHGMMVISSLVFLGLCLSLLIGAVH